ncbi:MAG: hypothetical protein IJN50_01380 [Clostridia bacterium]|nr:hypothetical protein [Clostridia bacterium]
MMIKRILDKAFESCGSELSKEEILKQYLEEYSSDIQYRSNVTDLFSDIIQYRGYRDILRSYKSNRNEFNKAMREARLLEEKDKNSQIHLNIDAYKNMVGTLRNLLRGNPKAVESTIIPYVQKLKNIKEEALKEALIKIIQKRVSFLNGYGMLEPLIEEANKELGELGLERLKYRLRNPLTQMDTIPQPDGRILPIFDENGKRIQYDGNYMAISEDSEDIGVLDAYSRESLQKYSPEYLMMQLAFVQSKYWEERIEMSKAMATIDSLELWGTIIDGDESDIQNLDETTVDSALIKDLFLSKIQRHGIEVTPKMARQYKSFIKQKGLDKKGNGIKTDILKTKLEIDDLTTSVGDITILQCLILQQLKEKNPEVSRWGIVKPKNGESTTFSSEKQGVFNDKEETSDVIVIAIDHKESRGELVLAYSEDLLKHFFKVDKLNFPEYKVVIPDKYSSVMAKLYPPVTECYKRIIKEEYKANPYSPILAFLNGKSPKKLPGQPNGGQPGGEAR